MRPLYLEFQAFNSYGNRATIDFTQFDSGSLFLVTGPTGAGKTTIFDAMKYALYGEASGSDRNKSSFVSDFAMPGSTPYVSFTFEHQGYKYKVTRTLEYYEKKKRGEGVTLRASTAELVMQGQPERVVATRRDQVDSAITELLGITSNQFSQIVMIAQGDFSKLLTANTNDRSRLLRNIFGTEIYARVQDELRQREADLRKQLDAFAVEAQTSVKQIQLSDTDKAEELTLISNNLETILFNLKKVKDYVNGKNAGFEREEKKIQGSLDRIRKYLADKNQVFGAVESIEGFRREKENAQEYLAQHADVLKQKKDNFEKIQEKQPRLHELTRLIASARDTMQILETVAHLEQQSRITQDEVKNSRQILNEANRDYVQSQENLEEIDKNIAKLQNSETKFEQTKAEKGLVDITIERLSRVESIKPQATQAKKMARAAIKKYSELVDKHKEARMRLYASQAGLLAQDLMEESPCPVCGSKVHPQPAPLEKNAPSKEQVEVLENLVVTAQKESESASSEAIRYNEMLKLYEEEAHTAFVRLNEEFKREDSLSNELTIENLPAIKRELDGKMRELEKQIQQLKQFKEERSNLLEVLEQCKERQNEVRVQVDSARERALGLESKIEGLKNTSEFEDAEQAKQLIANLETEYAELSHRLDEASRSYLKEKSEYEKKEEMLRTIENRISEAPNIDSATLRSEIETLNTEYRQISQILSQMRSVYTINQTQLQVVSQIMHRIEPLEDAYKNIAPLANLANAKTTGALGKLSLEVFAQITYFNRVIAAANERLNLMSSGRYMLVRKEDTHARRTTNALDMDVIDAYTGSARDTHTLSGGEKFITSLALALGFSDVIQRDTGGIQLDSMFIDEGFGSLDADALDSALKVLVELSNSSTLIGIISHVESLKDCIDQQVIVKKSNEGSQLEVVV